MQTFLPDPYFAKSAMSLDKRGNDWIIKDATFEPLFAREQESRPSVPPTREELFTDG